MRCNPLLSVNLAAIGPQQLLSLVDIILSAFANIGFVPAAERELYIARVFDKLSRDNVDGNRLAAVLLIGMVVDIKKGALLLLQVNAVLRSPVF